MPGLGMCPTGKNAHAQRTLVDTAQHENKSCSYQVKAKTPRANHLVGDKRLKAS